MKKIIPTTLLLTLALTWHANAQFIKNIKEMAVDRSKEVVQYKTNEKVAEKTAQGMDKILNANVKELLKGEEGYEQYEFLQSSYNFSYHYRMKTAINGRTSFSDYLLQPGAAFFGISSGEEEDELTIFEQEYLFTFTGTGKNKSVKSTGAGLDQKKEEGAYNFRNTLNTSELPPVSLVGHQCPGFQLRNSEKTVKYYILPGVQVAMPPSVLQSLNAEMPKSIMDKLLAETRGLIVSVEMTSNSDNKSLFHLECTELNQIEFVFETDGYAIK